MSKPRFVTANLKAARAEGKGNRREAIRLLEEAVEAYGEDIAATWKIAYNYMLLGEYDLAIEWGSRGLALEPGNTDLLQLLAACYSNQGDHDRAYKCVCRALEQPVHRSAPLRKWLAGLFSRRSGSNRTAAGREREISGPDMEDWRRRAQEYKAWYESTHKTGRRRHGTR